MLCFTDRVSVSCPSVTGKGEEGDVVVCTVFLLLNIECKAICITLYIGKSTADLLYDAFMLSNAYAFKID